MHQFRLWIIAALVLTIAQAPSRANALADETSSQSAFYTIEESSEAEKEILFFSGMESTDELFSIQGMALQAFRAKEAMVNLLKWALHSKAPPLPNKEYDRVGHFGRWINDPFDETCYNTRNKVLIRDSATPVSFRSDNHCKVAKGRWDEPYTGQKLEDSGAIQIDHMVPLKNAYMSGAWQWDFQTRCSFANFLGNKYHLIAADARENMRKGDRGPNKYLPPSTDYRCEYLENWLKIKLVWRLMMTPEEVSAIQDQIKEHNCNPRSFVMSEAQVKEQRKLVYANPEACPDRRRPSYEELQTFEN